MEPAKCVAQAIAIHAGGGGWLVEPGHRGPTCVRLKPHTTYPVRTVWVHTACRPVAPGCPERPWRGI